MAVRLANRLSLADMHNYQHAMDSGVYLRGVDSSRVGSRLPVDRKQIDHPAVFLIIGQSNGANHGETCFMAQEASFNFNPFDGFCYRACDPLLGATGEGGSPWCLLADSLIREEFARSILLCPLSVGGATVAEWAPGGPYHHRMTYAIERLASQGFKPSHILWHQGEADALYGTNADTYMQRFRALVASLRALEIAAPVYVAIASHFSIPEGYESKQAVIRDAQRALIDPDNAIFAGPDTDVIRDRYDGCHMGTRGLRDHAEVWKAALQCTIDPQDR